MQFNLERSVCDTFCTGKFLTYSTQWRQRMYAILQLGSLVPVFVRYDVPHQNRSLYDCLMRGDELLS